MADITRTNPKATTAPNSAHNQRTDGDEKPTIPERKIVHDPDPKAAHSHPQPGEFPSGPGNAGPGDHSKGNAGNPESTWTTKNMGIGLAIAVLVIVVLVMVF